MKYLVVITYVFLLIGPSFSQSAWAESSFNGIELYSLCNPNSGSKLTNSVRSDVCQAYIRGVAEGLFMGVALQKLNVHTCIPFKHSLDPLQTRLIVEKYMRDRPQKLNKPAVEVVFAALTHAYSCKKNSHR